MKRIVLVGVSGLMAGLVARTLACESDVQLIEVGSDPLPAGFDVDFIIVRLASDQLPESYLEVLERSPRTRVLGLDGDCFNGVLWQLRPERISLGPMSPEALLAAIREPGWRETGAFR